MRDETEKKAANRSCIWKVGLHMVNEWMNMCELARDLFIARLNVCNRSSPYMQMACNYNLIGKQIDVMTALNEPASMLRWKYLPLVLHKRVFGRNIPPFLYSLSLVHMHSFALALARSTSHMKCEITSFKSLEKLQIHEPNLYKEPSAHSYHSGVNFEWPVPMYKSKRFS